MTSSVPGLVAWPLLALMTSIAVMRYLFFSTSEFEKYLNHVLAIYLVCNLLREKMIEKFLAGHHIIAVTTAQELSLVAMILLSAEFLGFITLGSGLPLLEARRRHRHYRISAIILSIAFFISASHARATGQPLEVAHGWDIVLAWVLFMVIPELMAVRLVIMGVKEWMSLGSGRQERIVAACGFMVGIVDVCTSRYVVFYVVFQQLGWVHNNRFILAMDSCYFFWLALAVNGLAAIPIVRALSARAGLDGTSRSWRALQRFRETLTVAFPECVFELQAVSPGRRKTTLDLHQTVVQIRDAMLLLRPYLREISADATTRFLDRYSVPTSDRDAAIQALQIAEAVRAREIGATPERIAPAVIPKSRPGRSTTLDQEAAELVRLCKWWPSARTATHPRIGLAAGRPCEQAGTSP